jgi:hypothetical protein
MQTRRSRRKIELVYHRSFRRPVKIRVEAESPRSADRITSLSPAGTLLLINQRPQRPVRPQLRIVRAAPPEPDWRTVCEQDGGAATATEGGQL